MVESDSHNQYPASGGDAAASIGETRSGGRRRRTAGTVVAWLAVTLAAAILGTALWSYRSGGIVSLLLTRGTSAGDRVKMIQDYFESLGVAAPLVYVGVVTVEVVVAPIPGLMLYAPGGLVFGGFAGGLLALAGNVLGAGIACGLIRAVGGQRLASWLEQGRLKVYHERLSRSGLWLILLLRVNPLTSSDLVSYAAGLAGIPVWKVMAGTLLGMAPLCWAQAYLSDGMLRAVPQLIYPLAVLCGLYAVAAVWIVAGMLKSREPSS